MPNPNGNPDFGTKYRLSYGRDKPLTDQVKAVVYPEIKQKLKELADKKNCTVPDLVREALEMYLAGAEEQKTA